ncbi:thioredoxin family protein [Pedobacter immunditicola]|uniref:thioredoxin family protein n=1 Tax=Pedobacter immunditicola TaxID=3133440 RepID=UPI00309B2D1F
MEASDYVSDKAVVQALSPLLKGKHITIVWATWCGDSRRHVPQFTKVLEDAGFPEQEITLIEVNRDKKAIDGTVDHLNIERVPTFIIFEADKELGRIVEHPEETLEKDLLELLAK